jgi:hypothetical protein
VNLASLLIRLNAAVFIVYGVAFALAPETLSNLVTGGSPETPSGIIDMRSTYGGMSIGLGVLLVLTARDSRLHGLGLSAVLAVMSCMAGSRLLGIAVDGEPNSMMWAYLAVELLVAGIASWAIRADRAAV